MSDPARLGDVAMDVLVMLLERESRSAVCPVTEGNNRASLWENEGGPEGASTPESPALDQRSCVRGSASRGL